MHFRQLAALAASISVASAIRGFNTGNLFLSGAAKQQSDFAKEFTNQREITGTNGIFTAARLYTMIQGGTTNTPISAIPAAIASKTQLLLGMWASGDTFDDEMAALSAAIKQYGSSFTDLVTGISVGSEDLYRLTPTSIAQDGGVGADAATIASYIGQVKKLISGTALSSTPVGHTDTYTAWINGSNAAAAAASDFIGMNTFPYFQTTDDNSIQNAGNLFYEALSETRAHTGGKRVIITETGYPIAGPVEGNAIASPANAESYWQQVYCTLPASVDLFWYTQQDANSGDKATFGVTGTSLSTTPAYDLTCKAKASSSSSSSAAAHSSTATQSSTATSSPAAHHTALIGAGSGSGSSSDVTSALSSHADATSVLGSGADATSALSSHAVATSVVTSHATTTRAAAGSEATEEAVNGTTTEHVTKQVTAAASTATAVVAPVYSTASGMTSVAAVSTGAGLAAASTGPAPYQPANSGTSMRSTFALLVIPAVMAMML